MKLKNFRTIAVILVSDLLLLLKLREKKDSCKQDAICFVKALIPEAFWTSGGRSGPLERDLKRILCQHSRTIQMALLVGFTLSVPYTARNNPNGELLPTANEWPPFRLSEGKAGGQRDGKWVGSAMVENVDIVPRFLIIIIRMITTTTTIIIINAFLMRLIPLWLHTICEAQRAIPETLQHHTS